MGKVIVKVKLTSLKDLFLKGAGARRTRPRQVEVEALVDTGATRLCLKPSVIEELGLQRVDAVRSRTTNGEAIRFKTVPLVEASNMPTPCAPTGGVSPGYGQVASTSGDGAGASSNRGFTKPASRSQPATSAKVKVSPASV